MGGGISRDYFVLTQLQLWLLLSLKNSAKNSVKAEFSSNNSFSARPEPNLEKLTSVLA